MGNLGLELEELGEECEVDFGTELRLAIDGDQDAVMCMNKDCTSYMVYDIDESYYDDSNRWWDQTLQWLPEGWLCLNYKREGKVYEVVLCSKCAKQHLSEISVDWSKGGWIRRPKKEVGWCDG